MNDLKTIWTKTAELLQKRVNADTYDRWMAGIVPLRLEENDTVAVLGVSNDLFSDWLRDNYSDLIRETLLTASGLALKVRYESGYTPEVPPAPTAAAIGSSISSMFFAPALVTACLTARSSTSFILDGTQTTTSGGNIEFPFAFLMKYLSICSVLS